MRSKRALLVISAVTLMLVAAAYCERLGAQASPASVIPVKVVVISMFERGEDTGDTPGEYQFWVEREHLDQVFPLPGGYHHVRMNKDGVLGILTGVATAKAAASITALGLDPQFDLSKAYWIVAGIGGGDPADVSLGTAVWADHVIDSDIAYEIDAREIPKDWPTGFVPLRQSTPYEPQANPNADGEMYTLNQQLVAWALNLTHDVRLSDSETMRTARARYAGFPNAQKPPFVTRGDALSGSTFWHGAMMDKWANDWVRYFTGGTGNFKVCGMEDTGTLQALTFLDQARRADFRRVLVLRTVSNFDQQPPGVPAAESLKQMASGNYSAYMPALEAAFAVGDKVVRDIVSNWSTRQKDIPRAP